jgi:hypothetical protein
MGLLDAFLKAHPEGVQRYAREATPSNLFVDKVDKCVSTTSTNGQQSVIANKIYNNQPAKITVKPQDPIFSSSRNPFESTGGGGGKQNVDIVACVRGSESENLTSLSNKKAPSDPTPVGSFARASNIVYKIPECDSCPACGHWDGYGRMAPGHYCFFSAVFKGKTARPVPIAEAQKACAKTGLSENV